MMQLPETLANLASFGDDMYRRGAPVSGYAEIAMMLRDILKRLDRLEDKIGTEYFPPKAIVDDQR